MTAAAMPVDARPDWDRAPIELPQRERLEILLAVMLGVFLRRLDQTVVGTALPTIITDLSGNDLYTGRSRPTC